MILNKEPNYKRLISKTLHIHKQKQELNLQTDMDNLDLMVFEFVCEIVMLPSLSRDAVVELSMFI